MQDGNTGDIIRIKKDYKKSFKARILSNTTVEVVE
jgi:flagella basal body P-ring formation protein FlgA